MSTLCDECGALSLNGDICDECGAMMPLEDDYAAVQARLAPDAGSAR